MAAIRAWPTLARLSLLGTRIGASPLMTPLVTRVQMLVELGARRPDTTAQIAVMLHSTFRFYATAMVADPTGQWQLLLPVATIEDTVRQLFEVRRSRPAHARLLTSTARCFRSRLRAARVARPSSSSRQRCKASWSSFCKC
jgi:hypothetical protein